MAKKKDGMTKVEMVRAAIEKLGWDVSTATYQDYIKENFKTEMSIAHISQTKSAERSRQGLSRRRRKRGRPRKETVSAAGSGSGTASVADILAFVDTLRSYEARLGASSFREVVKTVMKK